MHKLVVLYHPPADKDKFRSYYESTHLPLAAKLPGLRAYRYAFNVDAPSGASPYWCIFEADYDDAAAMAASMQSEQGASVAADVANYVEEPPVMIHYEVIDGSS
jgi:uncharacterized protein (TIGR02118 family)